MAVAEELHFRRAAERLLLTQPALSHQIARLEHQLGVRLLDRDRRSVALTPAGKTLLDGARRALQQVDQSIAAARWTFGITSHALRLGYPGYAARSVGEILNAFRQRRPDLWVDEHQLQSHAIRAALLDRTLDIGFINLSAGNGLTAIQVVPDELTVVLPAGHRLATNHRVRLAQLAHEPLLMVGAGAAPGYHALITACCQQAGFIPTLIPLDPREPRTLEAFAHAVAEGRGLLLLPTGAPAPSSPDVVCCPADLPNRTLKLTVAWRNDNPSPAVTAFTDLVAANSPVSQ